MEKSTSWILAFGWLAQVRILVKLKSSELMGYIQGDDNPSTKCTVGDVPNVFEGKLGDHDGPYNGVNMGC